MKEIINSVKLAGKRPLLIIGDVMLDEYVFGEVSRISPEAPVPILNEQKREWSLGGASNVALNCSQVGFSVNLVGVIGDLDVSGQKFFSLLQQNNLSTEGIIKSKDRITTCKKRVLAKNQQILRVDNETTKELTSAEFIRILKKVEELMFPESIILLSDYAKGVLTKNLISEIILLAKKRRSIILLDPKGPDFSKYKGVNYLKPNLKEFGHLIDYFGLNSNNSLIENGKKVCDLLDLQGLIVTMGEKGMHYISRAEEHFIPACRREVFDITGAGDTVFAFLALGLAANLSILHSLKFANHAASIAVSHLKTYAVSFEELIDKNVELTEKVFFDWALLKIELDWLRLEKKKVVFTNGCFDILHAGHIHLLNESKKLGDILVVAINTDDSIKRYKGDSRPIKTMLERAKVLAAIGVVDFVVIFDQDTPKELIEYLKPDVLVKGGDYKKESIAGYEFMTNNGGNVVIVDYQEGMSTTNIINKIKSLEL